MSEALYDETYQKHYLAFLLRDSDFVSTVREDVWPELFTSEINQKICRLILQFVDSQGTPPGELIISQIEELAKEAVFQEADLELICDKVGELLDLKLQNRNYIIEQHVKFLKQKKLTEAIPKMLNYTKKGEFEKAEALLKEVFQYKQKTIEEPGLFLNEDPTDDIKEASKVYRDQLFTLIPDLDKWLAGQDRGTLWCWLSQTSNLGKTAACVHHAKAAMFQGKKVIVYTFEDSERNYLRRFHQSISGLEKHTVYDGENLHRALKELFTHHGGLLIKQFPGYTMTVEDLKRHKRTVENQHNFFADLVIVDYADLVKPSIRLNNPNEYELVKRVYAELRAWAVEDKIYLVTASQSQRGAAEEEVATLNHVSGSIGKAFESDIIVSLNRTRKERENAIMRLHIAKSRTSATAGKELVIKTQMETQRFYVPGCQND